MPYKKNKVEKKTKPKKKKDSPWGILGGGGAEGTRKKLLSRKEKIEKALRDAGA